MVFEVFCNLCAVGQGLVLLPFVCLLNFMIYSLWPLAWLVDWLGVVQDCRDGEVVGKAKGTFEDLGAVPRPRLLAVFRPLALEASSVRNIDEAILTPAKELVPSGSPSTKVSAAAALSSGPCTKDNSANAPTCASSSKPDSGRVSGVASGATAATEAPASCSGAVVPCSSSHEGQIRPVSTDSTDSRPNGGPCYNYETDTDDDEEDYRTITEIVRTTPAEKLLGSWRHDGMPALGTGGFGAVYRGHLPLSAGREIEAVAKIYSAAGDQGAVHMKRESRAMRMLQESGAEGRGCVLQMYAAGMHPSENRPMLLVELASSCLYDSLRAAERCRQNAGMTSADAPLMREAEMVGVLLAVAGALKEMHDIGIVHQDIKPENVLYRANGDPCVADMGLAVVLGPGRRSYRSGCGGTCWFAAPELGLHLPALTDWVMLRRSLEEQEQLAAAAAAGAQQLDEQVAMTEEESDETETETEEEESSGGMDLGSSLEGSGASEFESGSVSDSGSESGSESSEGQQSQQQQQHQPEQKQQKKAPALTPAVDVWSLGMLALSMAVTGNGVQAWAYAVMRRKALPGYVPTWVAALIRDCTEWRPRARPSAAQVLERLRAVKAGIVRRV